MKSYKVVEFGKPLQKVEEANPAPQGTEVLVRITAAGVCHSDVHLWEGYFDMGGGNKYLDREDHGAAAHHGPRDRGRGRRRRARRPRAPRSATRRWSIPGSAVANAGTARAGSEHLCPTPRALGVNKDGGYADHVLVPHAKYLYPYGNLPVELACLYACSGITAFGAVKKAVGHDAGKPILVIGAGGVGLMGVRFAKSVLGREPIVADIDEKQAQARPGERRVRRPRSARQGSAQADHGPDRRHRRRCGDRLRRRRGLRAVRRARTRPRRTAGRRRPVRRHLLHAVADVRFHRLPDHGLRDRQPGRDEGDDGPRDRRQGDAGARSSSASSTRPTPHCRNCARA